MWYKMVPTFEYMDEIPNSGHSKECYSAGFSGDNYCSRLCSVQAGTVYKQTSVVCGRNI